MANLDGLESIAYEDVVFGSFSREVVPVATVVPATSDMINMKSLSVRRAKRADSAKFADYVRRVTEAETYRERGRAKPNDDTSLSYSTSVNEINVGAPLKKSFADEAGERMMSIRVEEGGGKPEGIEKLEKVLSEAYNAKIEVTNVDLLPVTRKEVKRVHCVLENSVFQVWIMKAGKDTVKGLTRYFIASQNGVPTAKPIGFVPGQSYNLDIEILGGVVEHAGDTYNNLIHMLRLNPGKVFMTAEAVGRVLADFHVKLTRTKEEFEKYNAGIRELDVRDEIMNRFASALNLEERNVQGLIKAARELYNKQEGNKVVSHGDIHTKNIVTLTDYNKTVSQIATKVDEFGVIDLDSMVLDYPQGDLADFWLHHLRDARVECGNYSFDYEDYLKAYDSRIREFGEDFKSERNELISYVLWCVKELFDPTRKDGLDIQQKARFYAHLLRNGLDKLGSSGNDLGRELKSILRKTEYRDVW